jgi:hypothetical protein
VLGAGGNGGCNGGPYSGSPGTGNGAGGGGGVDEFAGSGPGGAGSDGEVIIEFQ